MTNNDTNVTFKRSSTVQICLPREHAALLIILDTHIYTTSWPMARSPILDCCFPMQDLSGDYDTYTSNANLIIIAYTLWPTMCLWICLIHLSETSNYHYEYMLTSFNHILTYIYLRTIIRVPDLIYHPSHGFLFGI